MAFRHQFPRTISVCAILAAALAARGAAIHHSRKASLPRALPEDCRVWIHAPTLDALIAEAKPTLHVIDGYGADMLIWTGTTTTGVRFFKLATARRYQPPRGEPEWILVRGNLPPVNEDAAPLPQITIAVGKLPIGLSVSTRHWARVAAANAKRGTVYEIAYFYQAFGEAAQSWRLFLLQDSAGKWHFVANIPGDFWDDTGADTQVKTKIRWTPSPPTPVELIAQILNDQSEPKSGRKMQPTWGYLADYTGPLPLGKHVTWTPIVQVAKGETLSEIAALFAALDRPENDAAIPKMAHALAAAIARLNPGVQKDRLIAGRRLRIPDPEERDFIYRRAERP